MTLTHLTLNTGDLRASPRSEVGEHAIRALDPLVRNRGGYVPGIGSDLELGFSLAPAKERCLIQIVARKRGQKKPAPAFVLAALAWGEDAADQSWRAMLRTAKREGISVSAEIPNELPSLIVLLTTHAAFIPREVLMAVGDFERCIAWTILAQEGLAP